MISGRQGENSMLCSRSHPAYVLSAMLAVVMILQAAGGLFIKGLYRDNAWVVSIYYGTDLVTLVVVIPILVVALVTAIRGSVRAQLIWLGVLYYAFYNNMYYLFGTAFNRFFLIYVVVFVLSSCALIAALSGTEAKRISELFDPGTPREPICVVIFLCAAILGIMWVGQSIGYVVNGQLPQIITDTGGNTHMIAALDLTMIVPPLTLGAIWLWKSRPWGYVVSTAMLVQCTIITAVLIIAAPFQAAAGIKDAWTMVPLWALMGAGFLVSSGFMLRSIKSRSRKQ